VSADSLEGRNLGKYRVLEPLGRGGMARVYRAYHPQLDRYVAIKVLRSDLVEEEEFLVRFQREARAVAALRHPNIVQAFDFDTQGDIYYMVMELLEGDTLRTRLNDYRARGERMPLGEGVRVLRDTLAGLAYAHCESMVHRDVKPANILLTSRGQAVLTDFGIAQIIGGTRYTVHGALMGTLAYMSPEQGLEGQCDARSDLYSLGIVFYEMLTGNPPFDAETPLAILMKHVNDPLPPPRKDEPAIPKPFERVVLKVLSKRPQYRYQSAEEMADALHKAAKRARVELPQRISPPLSFTTAGAPSESVAVLSGTAREKVVDVEFAAEDTDARLGERLALEEMDAAEPAVAALAVAEPAPNTAPASSERSPVMPAKEELAAARGIPSSSTDEAVAAARAALSDAGAALQEAADAWLSAEVPPTDAPVERRGVRRAVLSAVGLAVIGNLLAVLVGSITGWWGIYGRGWPFELLLVGLGLCLITDATVSVWLHIPMGIILGNGLLFSFYAITGAWRWWAFLWPLEPLIIAGSVLFAVWLSGQGNHGRQIARHVARSLQRPVMVLIPIVMVLGTIFG
jgi:serine/threonine protein kinase